MCKHIEPRRNSSLLITPDKTSMGPTKLRWSWDRVKGMTCGKNLVVYTKELQLDSGVARHVRNGHSTPTPWLSSLFTGPSSICEAEGHSSAITGDALHLPPSQPFSGLMDTVLR